MTSPPLTITDGLLHPDMHPSDLVNPFPKLEEIPVPFPPFSSSSQDALTSPTTHIPPSSVPFDPRPGSSHAASSMHALTQIELDSLDPMTGTEPTNPFLPSFPGTQVHPLNSTGDEMQGITPLREQSPGSVHTPSSNPSHAASPIPPPFSNSASSLASALDEQNASFLNRSRSGSLASPNTAGFVSRTSPPRSSQEKARKFSIPSDFASIPRPDPVNAPHMLVVDEVLNKIMRTAASARQACSMGQGIEANTKIDEMKKQIALVSELMAGTALDSPPHQDSPRVQGNTSSTSSSVSLSLSHRHSASLPRLGNATTPPSLIPNFPSSGIFPLPSGPPSLEHSLGGQPAIEIGNQGSPDSDGSRKRCASSMAGDRINKAIRLDTADGSLPPLTQPATPPSERNLAITSQPLSAGIIPSSASTLVGSAPLPPLPNSAPGPMSASLVSFDNISPGKALVSTSPPITGSASRPVSPPEAIDSNWQMLQKQISSAPVTGIHPSVTQSQSSFPLTAITSTSMSVTDNGLVSVGAPLNTWPDIAGVSVLPGSAASGMGTVLPQDLASSGPTTISPFGAQFPTTVHPPPLSIQAATVNGHPGMGSRSSSFSNQPSSAVMYGSAAPLHVGPPPIAVAGSIRQSDVIQSDFAPDVDLNQVNIERARARTRSNAERRSPSSSSCEDDGESDYEGYGQHYGHSRSFSKTSPPLKSRDNSPHRRTNSSGVLGSPTDMNSGQNASANEIPAEFRADVDRIFFEFLNKTCSNLDATDSKGELIHQTLMAKKMQRLDESPDFRPFKFRIQAFTNGFLEELARQGFNEEKIPMKKVRNYLWTQPYISRFNEDGKKAKSKGNHIWNIDAKKKHEGGWEFRPFHRKLAGSPPSIAYIGLRWSWTPRIWDPQASRVNIQVQYSSPNLPPWLSWHNNVLQGTPPPDAQSCEVTVEARTVQDGQEEILTQTFQINVSAVPTGTDLSFNAGPGRPMAALPPSLGQAPTLTAQDAQMMQVLTSAAQRVAQEAQAHVIAQSRPQAVPGPELQSLAKQQHVLTVTAQALDQEVSSPPEAVPPSSHALVAAAQQVVFQAARQVAADRTAVMSLAGGVPTLQQPATGTAVTVNEVSVATQTAVAQAVEITGPLSSEVDVMMTASSLLQHQTRPPPLLAPPLEAALAPGVMNGIRPHSTGTMPPIPVIPPPNPVPVYPPTLPPLSLVGQSEI